MRTVDRLTAWVIVALGSLLLVGGLVGTVVALQDDEPAMTAGRLAVMVLAAVGMLRAVHQLRRST